MKISDMKLKGSVLLNDLDKALAILGIIISFLLIILGGVKSSIMALLVGFLLLISCLLWLAIRKSDPLKFHLPESKSLVKFWAICFFALYALSILSVYFRPNLDERPLLYFILTALMAGAIACEILTAERRHAGFILIQVLLLGVSISWTQQLITPSLVGIDPWYHAALTNRIIADSFLPMDYSYSTLPLFHLMIATTSLITTLPYKLAAMVSVSFGQIACNAFFLFLIANYLFKNNRIGLLAALLVIIANLHILMSYWSIPNSIGAVFIPIILYLIFTRIKDTSRLVVSLLMILLMSATILAHSITAMCMAIILFVAWGASAFYQFFYSQTKDYISSLVPVGFTIGMFTWWSYMAGYVVVIAQFLGMDASLFYKRASPPTLYLDAILPHPGEYIFGLLGQNLFLTLSLIGILYMISRKCDRSTFSIALVSVSVLCIPFIAYFTKSEIIPYRWLYIAQILLSIPLALALYSVGTWKMKKPIYVHSFFLGFIVVLSFLMLMGPSGHDDNHTFTPTLGTQSYYTESEMVGSDFFAKKTIGVLSVDEYHGDIFYYVYSKNILPSLNSAFNSGEFQHDNSIKIFRLRFISQLQRQGRFSSKIGPDLNSYMSKSGFDKIYDSSAITGYIG